MRKRLRNQLPRSWRRVRSSSAVPSPSGRATRQLPAGPFEKSAAAENGSFSITAYHTGTYAGLMDWTADPIVFPDMTIPGDAFQVLDRLSDGYGMEATMISPECRMATTRGHSAV